MKNCHCQLSQLKITPFKNTVQPGHDFFKKITGKYSISRRSGNFPALIFMKSFRPGVFHPGAGSNYHQFINNYFRLFFKFYAQPVYQPVARLRQCLQFQKLYQQTHHGAPGLPGLSSAPFELNPVTYMKSSWNYTFSFQKRSLEHYLFLSSWLAKNGQGRALITLVSGKGRPIRARGPGLHFVNKQLIVSKPFFVTKREPGLHLEQNKPEAPGLKLGEPKIEHDFWRLEKSYGSSRLTGLIPRSFIPETREFARKHGQPAQRKGIFAQFRMGAPLSLELSNLIPGIDSQIIGRNETERLKSKAVNLARRNKAPEYTAPIFKAGRWLGREAWRLSTRGLLHNQLVGHIRENNLILEPMSNILPKFSLDGAGRKPGKTGFLTQGKKAITTARNELFVGKIAARFSPGTIEIGLTGMPFHTRRPGNAGLSNQTRRPPRMIAALENINPRNPIIAPPVGRGPSGPANRLAENSGDLILKKSLPPDREPAMENSQIKEKKQVTTSSASNHFIHEEKANAFPGINRIADQVYKILEKRLAIEKDRRGLR